ncbi:MAG: hypothetical protein KDJ27_19755 [Gammaproteobacteria bacterium]|nr:hypothetical protein [Gammaproteobacteria bacterium]
MNWLEMSETEILDIANPIMDNLMTASTQVDHARHVQDFTDEMRAIVTPENLEAQCRAYQAELGYFTDREFAALFRKETDVAVFWKQKYTLSTGEHIAFLRLIEIDDRILVQNVSVT